MTWSLRVEQILTGHLGLQNTDTGPGSGYADNPPGQGRAASYRGQQRIPGHQESIPEMKRTPVGAAQCISPMAMSGVFVVGKYGILLKSNIFENT